MDNPYKHLSNINPQREDGHREISNGVYSALIKANLTGGEYKISLAVIEKTWGYNKQSDIISCSQLVTMTGLSERMVKLVIKSLKNKKIIHYEPSSRRVNQGSPINEFIFNKHYDTWVSEGCNVVHGVKQNVKKGEIECKTGVKRSSPTKEIITKENNTKEIYSTAFECFWKEYPSRNGRKPTKRSSSELFKKIPDHDIPLIMQAVKNYSVFAGDFAKDGERFLKKDFWRDFIGDPVETIDPIEQEYLKKYGHLPGKLA